MGDANNNELTPIAANVVWLKQPNAQPKPNAMPCLRPRDMPKLNTMRLSGPGEMVMRLAASRKARSWSGVSMVSFT
jgi:hypothetical protein